MTLNAYFSLFTHTKQLLLVKFCDATAESRGSFWTHGHTDRTMGPQTDGQTEVEVEIVI